MSDHAALLSASQRLQELHEGWPWQVVGVFPTEENLIPTDGQPMWWDSFCYTVGFDTVYELWVPSQSIEGRYAGPELTGTVLNLIGAGLRENVITFGDDVGINLGVPDGDDVLTTWWIGTDLNHRTYRATNMSDASWCLPILWSSGLGWKDEP